MSTFILSFFYSCEGYKYNVVEQYGYNNHKKYKGLVKYVNHVLFF